MNEVYALNRFFAKYPKSRQIFGLLLQNMSIMALKNSPIWSHCSQQRLLNSVQFFYLKCSLQRHDDDHEGNDINELL